MRLKNRARALGQNSIFKTGNFFLWAKLVKLILKRIRQETIIAYFSLRNTNHLILGRKDGKENWTDVFKMASKTCKENKLKEFQFKFIHRIVITKKELFRYEINTDSDCIYCGEPDSVNHTFIDCKFTKTFTCKITQNGSKPDTKETLFATFKHSTRMELVRKFNYTLLYMKFYVYM